MNGPRSVSAALATLVAVITCACGTTPGKSSAASNSESRLVGTPDQLLAQAITPLGAPLNLAAALPRIQAASERAPDRPELAWLWLRLCTATAKCAPEPLETRLRQLDPDNGVVWLGPLQRAQQTHDTAAEAQILDAMGRARYADMYWNRLVWHSATALADAARTNNPKLTNVVTLSLADASNWLLAVAVPDFAPVGVACSEERIRDAATAARCARVATVLEGSDTMLTAGVGLGIAERLAKSDPRASQAVATRIVNSRYLFDTASQVISGQIEREKFSLQQLELMKKTRREQEVFSAVIRWAGLPLTP